MTVDFRGKKLGSIFRALGLIDEAQEIAALSYAKALGCPIGQACVRLGFLEEEDLLEALAAQAGVQMTSISDLAISPLVLGLVPSRVAERLRAIPLELVKTPRSGRSTLVVATAKPRDLPAFDELEFLTGHRISPVATTDEEIDLALLKWYGVKLDASDLVSFDDEDAEPTMSKDVRTPSPTPRPPRH
jgi:type IV pilus assembly protein PilB